MQTVSNSGKADYYGKDPHPFFKRVMDHLPAGKLLLTGEVAGQYALYAAEVGWEVHTISFDSEDLQRTQALAQQEKANISASLYQSGESLCPGEVFDAVVLMFAQLPATIRRQFHLAVSECLDPNGGNLYLLAYSQQQPKGTSALLPEVGYTKAELMEDFRNLQLDLLQEEEEELPQTNQKVQLIHLTAVRTHGDDHSSDTVSFSLKD